MISVEVEEAAVLVVDPEVLSGHCLLLLLGLFLHRLDLGLRVLHLLQVVGYFTVQFVQFVVKCIFS